MSEICYREIPEETVSISLPDSDGLHMEGILTGKPDQSLVVMMHGRGDDAKFPLQDFGARYLYQIGMPTLRLEMYGYNPGTRNLVDCTLGTHVNDFEAAVRYVREAMGVPVVYGIGHSYGGLTILSSTAELNGLALWEPSHGSFFQDHSDDYRRIGGLVIDVEGKGSIMGERMHEEDLRLGDTSTLAAKSYPLMVASASLGVLVEYNRRYFAAANRPRVLVEIADAGHNFDDSDGIRWELFEKTGLWLKKLEERTHD